MYYKDLNSTIKYVGRSIILCKKCLEVNVFGLPGQIKGNREQRARMEFLSCPMQEHTFLTGKVDSLKEGVFMARTVMERGSVRQKIDEFIRISNNL
jgi:hypothetical protein